MKTLYKKIYFHPFCFIKEALNIYKTNFKSLLFIILIPFLSNFFFNFFVNQTPKENTFNLYYSSLSFIFLLIIIFIQINTYLALIYFLLKLPEKTKITEALKKTFKKSFSYFWLLISSSLIILGSSIFLVIPALVLFILFYFKSFILVEENLKGFKNLIKSSLYVKENWLKTFFYIISLIFVFFVFLIIIGLLLNFKNLSPQPFKSILFQILISLFMPLVIIYNYLIYKEIKKDEPKDIEKKSFKTLKTIFLFLILIGILVLPLFLLSILYLFNLFI